MSLVFVVVVVVLLFCCFSVENNCSPPKWFYLFHFSNYLPTVCASNALFLAIIIIIFIIINIGLVVLRHIPSQRISTSLSSGSSSTSNCSINNSSGSSSNDCRGIIWFSAAPWHQQHLCTFLSSFIISFTSLPLFVSGSSSCSPSSPPSPQSSKPMFYHLYLFCLILVVFFR